MTILSRMLNVKAAGLCGSLLLSVGSAWAQGADSGRLPPPPLPIPTGSSVAPGAAAPIGAMPGPESVPPPALPPDVHVEAGVAEEQRKALLGRILEAKSRGIGTSTYMMAFDALEQQVKGGDSEANVLKRVSSLNSSLDDQFKRSAQLKVQRPAPPIAASAPAVPFGSGGPGGGTGGNTDTAALIQKLQNKFGGQIPDLQNKYGGQIPDGLKDKLGGAGGDPSSLLKNPEIQDLLKKYGK